MLAFLITGAASPEPSDHPSWLLAMLEMPIAGSVIQSVVYMCLPAYLIADLGPSSEVVFWGIACLMQSAIYYCLGYVVGIVLDLFNTPGAGERNASGGDAKSVGPGRGGDEPH